MVRAVGRVGGAQQLPCRGGSAERYFLKGRAGHMAVTCAVVWLIVGATVYVVWAGARERRRW